MRFYGCDNSCHIADNTLEEREGTLARRVVNYLD